MELFARIEGHLHNPQTAPAEWKWAFIVAGLVIVMLNVNVVLRPLKKAESSGINTVVTAMNLSGSNMLYNE